MGIKLRDQEPVLLCIDLQRGFAVAENGPGPEENHWGGARNNPDAEKTCARAMTAWRNLGLPILHVQQASTDPASPLHPSRPGFAFQAGTSPLPGEPVIRKSVNSAFIGTDLSPRLDKLNTSHLVICGLTTDHCVSTTTRMAANLGYTTTLLSDATATFARQSPTGETHSAETIHTIHLTSLNGEFATVQTCAQLLERL